MSNGHRILVITSVHIVLINFQSLARACLPAVIKYRSTDAIRLRYRNS